MTKTPTAAPAGDALDALAAARKAMAEASAPILKSVLEKADEIPIGKLGDVIAMLLPMLPDSQVKTALSLMSNQLPQLPQLLKQAFTDAQKVDA